MATNTTKMQKLSFQWEIKNFDDCDLVIDEFFDSPQFSATDPTFKSDWKLRMYPAGLKERKNPSLLLRRLDSGSIFYTKHLVSFLNRNGCRIEIESCSNLCQTDSTKNILEVPNIFEIKKNALRYTDGGVLSVLSEIEIYEKKNGIEGDVQEKHLQTRGTSWAIQNLYTSLEFQLNYNQNTKFYQPFGKFCVCFIGTIKIHANAYHMAFEIIDDVHPEIEEVPITITFNKIKSYWNIKRSSTITVICNATSALVQISARCMVYSQPKASQINITPYMQKVQSDYRHMFSQSEGGDICIAVDGKTLRVHSNILSNRCPVFAAMFSQEWSEQNSQTVTIKNFDYKTVLAMMEFIYYGGGEDDNGEEAANPVELLKAAHMYQLDDLKRKCEQRLCQNLEKNVVSCMALAETYDLPDLINELLLCFHKPHNEIKH